MACGLSLTAIKAGATRRAINHVPSDRNPGPYLYPKKCHWSPVPSSIKETDSSNKEAPYQISAREPEATEGPEKKVFIRATVPGALTLGGMDVAGVPVVHRIATNSVIVLPIPGGVEDLR